MKRVHKNVLVPHTAPQMRQLVEGVEHYPEFLPWCGNAVVLSRNNDITRASIQICYHGLNTAFTTENRRCSEQVMEMTLVEGPFRVLQGRWRFGALDESSCKVDFDLQYEFSSRMLAIVAGPLFHKISDSLVDAFVRRADAVYGFPN